MLKRWCGNIYSTFEEAERSYQTFNNDKQKVVLAAMAANTNHTDFVEKSKSHKLSPLNAFPFKCRVNCRV